MDKAACALQRTAHAQRSRFTFMLHPQGLRHGVLSAEFAELIADGRHLADDIGNVDNHFHH